MGYDLGFTAEDLVVTVDQTLNAFTMKHADYPTWSAYEFYKERQRRERQTSYVHHTIGKYVKNEKGAQVPADPNDRLLVADDLQAQLWWTAHDERNDEAVHAEAKAKSEAMQRAIRKVQKQALEALFPDYELTYNRKAGCSCGCSQGFQMRSRETGSNDKGKIIFVTISCPAKA